jgi:hypothetical protein
MQLSGKGIFIESPKTSQRLGHDWSQPPMQTAEQRGRLYFDTDILRVMRAIRQTLDRAKLMKRMFIPLFGEIVDLEDSTKRQRGKVSAKEQGTDLTVPFENPSHVI